MDVHELNCNATAITQLKRVRLSWYRPAQAVHPGEVWRLSVKLKRPHGFANPGLFDYSAWLAQQGIGATGYVNVTELARRVETPQWSLNRWRAELLQQLAIALPDHPQFPIIAALALGDRNAINDGQWQVIRDSGTSHLLAISGLHIGLVGAFFWWLGGWLWRCWSGALLIVPAPLAGAVLGCTAALSYALLSGFAVPAQRSMIMFALVVVATLLRRDVFNRRGYLLALTLVLAWQPMAVMQAGFWLSFGALLIIGWSVLGRSKESRWKQLLYIQLALWVGLAPLSMLFFDQLSLVALPANLIAIPAITLLVLPLALVGISLLPLAPFIATPVLEVAADAMALTWQWLEWVSAQGAVWASGLPLPVQISPWSAVLAFAGMLWLFAPRQFPARWAGLALQIPLLVPTTLSPEWNDVPGHFTAQVVDVGQGLAVIVTTAEHSLVYDTGARFSDRFDAGADLLVPTLRQLVRQRGGAISKVVISHADSDHAGGLSGLLAQLPATSIDSGTPEQLPRTIQADVAWCQSGDRWRWNEVWFEYLHQPTGPATADNDRSCVLRIGGDGGLLLPGDISDRAERLLIDHLGRNAEPERLHADVLLVPHHGSRHSSSKQWLQAVNPDLAVVSSGYANRFGHPHPDTVARYRSAEIEWLNTAQVGAIALQFDSTGLRHWRGERLVRPRYWH